MKSFVNLLLVCLMMFFGCNSPVYDNTEYSSLSTIKIETDAEKQELKFSEIAQKIEFVPLETKEGLLVSGVRNVFFNNEHIILYATKNVWIFNREGNHLITLEAVGEGPGEFSYISSIEVNFEKKELYIIDFYKQKLLTFNINGTFKSEFKTGFFVDDFLSLDDGKFVLFTNDPNENTVHHVNFYNSHTEKIYSKHFPMNLKRLEFLNYWKNTNFFKWNEQIYFNLNPYDTIYSVTDESISARFISDYGKNKIPVSDYDKQFEDILHFNNYIKPLNYAYNWDKFFLVKDRLYFTFAQNGRIIRAFADIDKYSSGLIETFVDDLSLSGEIITFDEWIWPLGNAENDLVFMLESMDFKQFYGRKVTDVNYDLETSANNIRLILDDIDIVSNPVLVFLKQ
ncbi:MAG: 6-bladed beta-propeller [Bacteroidales bacterium]|nr:6-bladed beta-propeller [Bacteroidales bacterium]